MFAASHYSRFHVIPFFVLLSFSVKKASLAECQQLQQWRILLLLPSTVEEKETEAPLKRRRLRIARKQEEEKR